MKNEVKRFAAVRAEQIQSNGQLFFAAEELSQCEPFDAANGDEEVVFGNGQVFCLQTRMQHER